MGSNGGIVENRLSVSLFASLSHTHVASPSSIKLSFRSSITIHEFRLNMYNSDALDAWSQSRLYEFSSQCSL